MLGSRREGEAALLYDHDSRRALELTGGAPHGGMDYLLFLQEVYRPFWRRGLAGDILDSRRSEWESKPLVLAPHLFLLHPGVAQRLAAYVERGGILLGSCLMGWVDETNRCLLGGWPGEGLRKVFGLWMEELDQLPAGTKLDVQTASGNEFRGSCRRLAGVVHPEGAETLASFSPGPFIPCGRPAVLRHAFGQGEAWFLAGEFDRPMLSSLAKALMERAGLAPALPQPLPDDVVYSWRGTGSRRFWFFSNLAPEPREIQLPKGARARPLAACEASLTGQRLLLPARADIVLEVA
ncbi:MAG: beta-galactosidase trimerization domain-containing protein [Terrimicrobiaceae bacterium]|nr:beta-galactosidase trimerization domain-containing protein [Terrimicrobiaceae bacterium]